MTPALSLWYLHAKHHHRLWQRIIKVNAILNEDTISAFSRKKMTPIKMLNHYKLNEIPNRRKKLVRSSLTHLFSTGSVGLLRSLARSWLPQIWSWIQHTFSNRRLLDRDFTRSIASLCSSECSYRSLTHFVTVFTSYISLTTSYQKIKKINRWANPAMVSFCTVLYPWAT